MTKQKRRPVVRLNRRPQSPVSSGELRRPVEKPTTVDLELFRRADRLLSDPHPGDDHYPGDVNRERVGLRRDLPRRT